MDIQATQLLEQWSSHDVNELLRKWQQRARTNQMQHYEAAKIFDRAHRALGIPVVVLSTVVGTAVFATLQKQVGLKIQLFVGSLSVLAAILAALQTFLRFSERAEKHRSTAATYSAVRHGIEMVTHEPVALRGPLKEFLEGIRTQIDSLAQSAPNVPDRVWRRIGTAKDRSYFGAAPPNEVTHALAQSAVTVAQIPGREPDEI